MTDTDADIIAALERDVVGYDRLAGEHQKKANEFRIKAMRARKAIEHLERRALEPKP